MDFHGRLGILVSGDTSHVGVHQFWRVAGEVRLCCWQLPEYGPPQRSIGGARNDGGCLGGAWLRSLFWKFAIGTGGARKRGTRGGGGLAAYYLWWTIHLLVRASTIFFIVFCD